MKSFFLRSLPLRVLPLTIALFVAPRVQAQLQFGNALSFNGGNQYVTISNFGNIIPTTEVTVEFWADTSQFATQSAFMLSPDQGTNRFNAHINYNSPSPGVIYWDFGNISGAGRLGPINAPANSIGNWTHYAFVASQSGGFMRIYTNGVLAASKSGMAAFARGNYNLQIGGPGFPYNGSLDEFRVWSVARSQQQIQTDLYDPLVGNEPNLLLYYKFDSTSGTVAVNSATATGPAYNGTLFNAPTWVTSSIPAPATLVTNDADSGPGTLRNVVLNAPSGSTITFAESLSGQTIVLTNGEVDLTTNLTIDASALTHSIQINGNANSRIFGINNSGVTVTLNSLTLTNAANVGAPGPDFGSAADSRGGAIYNAGNLIINNCTLAGNSAQGGDGENAFECVGGRGLGGGIYNDGGTLTVNDSTLAGNTGNGGNGGDFVNGGDGLGGGIFNSGILTLNNSTLANNGDTGGNSGQGVNGANGQGGAIYNTGTLVMNFCTLADNSGTGGQGGFFAGNGSGQGGGVYSTGTLSLTNTIVCGNAASSNPNIFGPFSTANDLVDASVLLAPLGNYGGPTPTMPPQPGSAAIDAGRATAFATDQRGLPRTVGAAPDIGAVELQPGEAFPFVLDTLDNGPGSLRQSIAIAPLGSTVKFDPALSGQTITLTSGQIVLSNSVFIYGTGLSNGIQINGHGTSRIFQVNSGTTVILDGLTLTNGNPGANPGGAIFNSSGTLLELAVCTLAGNSSSQGGAIENQGTCALFECTLTGNSASGNGGAIDNNQGPLQLLQCTLSSNTASGAGGGFANFLNTLAMTNCIVAGNSSSAGSPDIFNFGSSTINAGGTNLVQSYGNAGTFNGTNSLVSKAPLLAGLGNYGGLTPTMPPQRGSPAIDGGSAAALVGEGISLDQRGYPRVSGDRVDIGAVEVQIAAANFPITDFTRLTNGVVQLSLLNLAGGSFTVFASTNAALPFNIWSNLGPVLETPVGSGVFQFTDTHATNFSRRFYRVSSP